MPKIAVVLSGCGVYDGTEVHEAAAALAALTRAGAEVEMFAPDVEQAHVVNHRSGEEMEQKRSVMVESARIARGQVSSLTALAAEEFEAVVLPGGFGAAKNLSDYGMKGQDMSVNDQVERVIVEFHSAGKPLGLCCIAPIIVAKVLGDKNPLLTLGCAGDGAEWPYQEAIEVARGLGGNMQEKNVGEVCVDTENKIVTTPAYMYSGKFHEIQDGVSSMINELIKLL